MSPDWHRVGKGPEVAQWEVSKHTPWEVELFSVTHLGTREGMGPEACRVDRAVG